MFDPCVVKNNIFSGPGTQVSQASAVLANNFAGNPGFVNAAGFDYRLTAGSACINAGTNPGNSSRGFSLIPTFEYVHPTSSVARSSFGSLDIGAHEFGTGSGSCAWRSETARVSVSSMGRGWLLALRTGAGQREQTTRPRTTCANEARRGCLAHFRASRNELTLKAHEANGARIDDRDAASREPRAADDRTEYTSRRMAKSEMISSWNRAQASVARM